MGKLEVKRGKYGKAKYKAFTVMLAEKRPLSSRELVALSGLSYYSLARLLPWWFQIGYVERSICCISNRGDYCYEITSKAQAWLLLARQELPNASIFELELQSWQEYLVLRISYQALLDMKFNDFTAAMAKFAKKFKKIP